MARGERQRVDQIVQQLCALLSNSTAPQPANARNGGLIGLAGIAIALGQEISVHLVRIVDPILVCFSDSDPKTRYVRRGAARR